LGGQVTSFYSQPVTFYTLVLPDSCQAPPSGNITFMNGSTVLGTVKLNQWGVITFTTASLSAGKNVITAVYSGDDNFAGDVSNTWIQWVRYRTNTNLTINPDPSVFGQSVRFTAQVNVQSPGSGMPTGNVIFYDNQEWIGIESLSGNTATINYSSLRVKSRYITAVYSGDNLNESGASSPVKITVNKSNTSISLSTSGSLTKWKTVTFNATVNAVSPGSGVPGGTVTFYDGSKFLETKTLSGGKTLFSTSTLSKGSHLIKAFYNGDDNFNSSSNFISLTIN
jgi:large repetitive protein